jgi:hypothetical protein
LHDGSGDVTWVQYTLITQISYGSKLAFLIFGKLTDLWKLKSFYWK